MKTKGMICLLVILSLFCISCGSTGIRSSSYSKEYLPGEDFEPSSQMSSSMDIVMAPAETGMYFIAGQYLFFLDYATMKANVLCFKTDCLHNEETDQTKTLDCNAYLGITANACDFAGYYKGKVYVACRNRETMATDLIEMDPDGSSRKVLLSNLEKNKVHRPVMHRGVIYYTTGSINLGGDRESALMAIPLLGGDKEPEVVYHAPEHSSLTAVFPYRDQVFFVETVYKEGSTVIQCYNVEKYDIKTQKTEKITHTENDPGSWLIFGGRDNSVKLLYGSERKFYEYSLTDRELREDSSGIAAFAEAHPGWSCLPECISEDMNGVSCFDSKGTKGMVPDLYMTDGSGKELCVIPDEGWTARTGRMVFINDEEYYVKFSKSIQPFSLKLYKKADIEAGIVAPIIPLQVEDLNRDLVKGIVRPRQ